MNSNEEKLSRFIDNLNKERKPDEDEYSTDSSELRELFETVRKVRTLKEPDIPDGEFPRKLSKRVERELNNKEPRKKRSWPKVVAIAAAAAILVIMVNMLLPMNSTRIVQAMEAAFEEVESYHGVLKIMETNSNGDSVTQAMLDVWADKNGNYYTKGLKGATKDIVTVNNGERKWQLLPGEKEVHILPAFPDSHRFGFELGNEINHVKNALTVEEVGEDEIVGRKATVLEVVPKGGETYKIWVDKETNIPLQKQSPMHNAIQYTITYTEIDLNEAIPESLLAFKIPQGYQEINHNPEQVVSSLDEAGALAGFDAMMPSALPEGYKQDRIAVISDKKIIKVYYQLPNNRSEMVFIQGKANDDFEFTNRALKGKIGELEAEIQMPLQMYRGILNGVGAYANQTNLGSIRWQEGEVEYGVIGGNSLEDIIFFTENITNKKIEIPSTPDEPAVKVSVVMEEEENAQKSVDGGSSPWRLDPLYSAQIFVSLKMSPDGVEGDYPIKKEELKTLQNDGKTAVIEVNGRNTPIRKVYLEKLVRQDTTGIWTVVGYNPA